MLAVRPRRQLGPAGAIAGAAAGAIGGGCGDRISRQARLSEPCAVDGCAGLSASEAVGGGCVLVGRGAGSPRARWSGAVVREREVAGWCGSGRSRGGAGAGGRGVVREREVAGWCGSGRSRGGARAGFAGWAVVRG
ncbi:hypothetical protein GCM10009744_61770 [Kribbella alba]|uniref:Uncharacterized protein n=1 Tax=Kribbella alba TaxID=190197 RepID=A0ABN2FUI6_9ACTN